MLPLVTWFRNSHDHSLHYFKFGLMQLAKRGEIRYREIANKNAGDLLPQAIRTHHHRRTAAVRIDDGRHQSIVVLDGEDSIFQTSPLIEHCDLYFSCTYRRKFFESEPFDLELPWQTECEVEPYRKSYAELQNRFRPHLRKARPLMPIGPAMEMEEHPGWLSRKIGAVRHRFSKLRAPRLDWIPQYDRFQRRWDYLMRLRELKPEYDVVLKDSLWGWPRHRVALHRELQRLSGTYQIHSELHFREVFDFECGTHPRPRPEDFPMIAGGGVKGDYEEMLAKSRLGVFATGFHYGCRNIVTLCWFLGLKTVIDPFSYEAIYDFAEMEMDTHMSGDWSELPAILCSLGSESAKRRIRRREAFDSSATPERAARFIVATAN